MGISKSQAAALADGFMDQLGEEKAGLQPKETFTELFLLAGELIEDAQKNLNQTNSVASGGLSKSLQTGEPYEHGDTVFIDIGMSFYGDFVNKGVKGTKSGAGLYSFKSEFPSTSMVKALQKGINRAKKSTTNVNRSKTVSKNEIKNVKISDIDKAYGAARNIKMYGIKANGFLDKAIAKTRSKIASRLGSALSIDILNSL